MMEAPRDRILPAVQALRGIAASLVVFHHFARLFKDGSPSPSWIYKSGLGNLGMSGVDIFFVISGFIMVYTTREKVGASDALTFIRRRVLRIYPLYWVWTSLLLVLWLGGVAERTHHYSPSYSICSYFLIPSFNGTYFQPLLGQGWTLSFEMFFYIVFCCAILLKLKSGKLPFVATAFLTLALLSGLLAPVSGVRFLLTNPIIIEFLYGMAVAELLVRLPAIRSRRLPRALPILLMTVGGLALLSTVKLQNADSMRYAAYGIPAFLIVLGGAMLGSAGAPRLLVYLGDCSYSIYLTHVFFALAYASALKHLRILSRFPSDLVILVAGVMTIALSSLTYGLFERPLTRALLSRTGPKPVGVPIASAFVEPRSDLVP